jgi:hypothetical protein
MHIIMEYADCGDLYQVNANFIILPLDDFVAKAER